MDRKSILAVLSIFCVMIALTSTVCFVASSFHSANVYSDASSDDSGECGDGLTWAYDDGALTISYSGTGTGVMKDYVEYSAPAPWFGKKIVSLTICDDCTHIGDNAFNNGNLGADGFIIEKIKMPNNLESIGTAAFYRIGTLESVEFNNGLKTIGIHAFYDTGLKNIEIPSSVTMIKSYAFSCFEKSELKQVKFLGNETILQDVYTVFNGNYNVMLGEHASEGYYAKKGKFCLTKDVEDIQWQLSNGSCGQNATWDYDINTKTLSLGGEGEMSDYSMKGAPWINLDIEKLEYATDCKITKIGDNAFNGCTSLAFVHMPDSLTEIGDNAFNGCTSLTSVHMPDSLIKIGDNAFNGCTSLASVHMPDSMKKIGEQAFHECTSLTSVTMPDSMDEIAQLAFCDCTSLDTITIPSDIKKIKNAVFSGCSSLKSVYMPNSLTEIGDNAFNGCTSLKSVSIPSGVTNIGNQAFRGCTSLDSVSIPSGVKDIDPAAFNDCCSLENINVDEYNTAYSSRDGILFSKDESILVRYPEGKKNSGYEIPNSVTNIGNQAFRGCTSLDSVSIPSGVTNIENQAFYGCTSLDSVSIPSGVTNIGIQAFRGCTSLITVSFMETDPPYLQNSAFNNCPLENIIIPLDSKDKYEKAGWPEELTSKFKCFVNKPVPTEGLVYNGSEQNGFEQIEYEYYTLSGVTKGTDAGVYEATAKTKNGYIWSDGNTETEIEWSIAPRSISDATVTLDSSGLVYNGQSQTKTIASVTVKVSDTVVLELTAGDYTVSENQQTNAGNYTMAITGKGNFNDSKNDIAWSIAKATPKESDFIYTMPEDLVYSGTDKTATVTAGAGIVGMGCITVKYYSDAEHASEVTERKNVGTYYVAIDVAEGENYIAGTIIFDVSWNFVITPKAVTVTANDASKTYSDADPELTATVSGLVGADTVVYTVIRAAGENARTYNITATGDTTQGNYTVSFVKGTFTINKKAITVTADDKSKTYGDADPELTATVSGLVGADTVVYTVTRAAREVVGTYTITPSGSEEQGNYKITFVNGTFTINRKDITVTADDKFKVVGHDDPELTATVSGLVGADTVVYTVTRAAGEDVGTYEITPSGDKTQGNYTITFVNGTFTITLKNTPSAEDFKYDAPSELTYDGNVKSATVTVKEGVTGMGEITVKYYSDQSCTAPATPKDVGTYYVAIDVAESSEYSAASKILMGSFTIEQKNVTVKADDKSKNVGGEDPELTATVTGLVGEDAVSYTISRAPGETAGTYAITVTGETSQGNYSVTFVNGTFTIKSPGPGPTPPVPPTPIVYHTVSYDVNGGSEPGPGAMKYEEGSETKVAYYSGHKGGCEFAGWFCNGKAYQPGDSFTVNSDMTFTALWFVETSVDGKTKIAGDSIVFVISTSEIPTSVTVNGKTLSEKDYRYEGPIGFADAIHDGNTVKITLLPEFTKTLSGECKFQAYFGNGDVAYCAFDVASHSGENNAGLIIGIVVGVTVVIALIGSAVYFTRRK